MPDPGTPSFKQGWRIASVLAGAVAKACVFILVFALSTADDPGRLAAFCWDYALVSAIIALAAFGPMQLVFKHRRPFGRVATRRLAAFVAIGVALLGPLVSAIADLAYPSDGVLVTVNACGMAVGMYLHAHAARTRSHVAATIASSAYVMVFVGGILLTELAAPLLVTAAASLAQAALLAAVLPAVDGDDRLPPLRSCVPLLIHCVVSNPLFVLGDLCTTTVVAMAAPDPAAAIGTIGILRQAANACLLLSTSNLHVATPDLLADQETAARRSTIRRITVTNAGLCLGSGLLLVGASLGGSALDAGLPVPPADLAAYGGLTGAVMACLQVHGAFQLHAMPPQRMATLLVLRAALLALGAYMACTISPPDLLPLAIILPLLVFLVFVTAETARILHATTPQPGMP